MTAGMIAYIGMWAVLITGLVGKFLYLWWKEGQ